MRLVSKREVTEAEFEAYLVGHANAPLVFDGFRYTTPVKMNGLTWNKPVAAKADGKFILIEDK